MYFGRKVAVQDCSFFKISKSGERNSVNNKYIYFVEDVLEHSPLLYVLIYVKIVIIFVLSGRVQAASEDDLGRGI